MVCCENVKEKNVLVVRSEIFQQQQNSIRGSTSSVTGDAASTSPLLPSILENSNKENIASVNKTFNKNDNVVSKPQNLISKIDDLGYVCKESLTDASLW